jgi:hypothetical protein
VSAGPSSSIANGVTAAQATQPESKQATVNSWNALNRNVLNRITLNQAEIEPVRGCGTATVIERLATLIFMEIFPRTYLLPTILDLHLKAGRSEPTPKPVILATLPNFIKTRFLRKSRNTWCQI